MEEKVNLIRDQSPWAEDIEEFGEINFENLLYLLTGFRNIPEERWADLLDDDLEGLIDRMGQENLTTLMRKVMPSCSEFLRKCWWRGEEKNCTDLFDVRKTDDGFCCSFNTLDQTQNLDISLVVESTNNAASNFANNLMGIFGGIFDTDYEDEALTTSPQPPPPSIQAVVAETTTARSLIDGSLKKGLDILSTLSRRSRRQAVESGDEISTTDTDRDDFNATEMVDLADEDEEEILDIGSFDSQKALQKLKRSNSASYLLGLSVLLDAKSDNYFVSPENYVGFKVSTLASD